jgi:hypothetical protein
MAAEHHRAAERRKVFKLIIAFMASQQRKGIQNWKPVKMHEVMECTIDDAPSMPQLRKRLSQLHDERILYKVRSESWTEGGTYCLADNYDVVFAEKFPEVVIPREEPEVINQWPLHALFFGRNVDEPVMLA